MARIQESEIERLKKEISLERLVEARGVKLRRHGKDLLGLCPFHDDREPSLVISPETNLWHCMGACQRGGSVVDWVMKTEGLSFRHAIEFLRDGRVSANVSVDTQAKKSRVRKLEKLAAKGSDDDALMLRVTEYYHRTLLESPEARAYLAARGLENAEAITHFKLGFSNRTLGYRLPEKDRKEGAELRGQLARLGIFRESGHEHMNGSLVIPIFQEGHVVGMYGRKITPNLRAGTPQHTYLPGPHRGVWNEDEMVSPEGEVILCESLIDALTFWSAGFRHVTTSYGVSGFTDDHREAFRRRGVKAVRIAYDRDDAGDAAAATLSVELQAMGIETYRVLFPRGMDANEYAMKVTPREQSLGLVLRKAEWLGKGARPEEPAEPVAMNKPEIPEPETLVQNAIIEDTPSVEPSSILAAPLPSPSEDVVATTPAMSRSAAAADVDERRDESGDEATFRHGDREWRVRGLAQNRAAGSLRVNLCVRREGGARGFFVDTLELYSSKQRAAYVRQAAEELELEERVVKRELGEVLLGLEQLQDARIEKELGPKEPSPAMTERERDAALALLRAPDLLDRVLLDLERCGIVGERENKLLSYLAATSRKLDTPLAVVIQSSSAAGKSSLMDAALSLMPDEECVRYSAMTGQSLFYLGETDVRHKILAIAEEEGASRASDERQLLLQGDAN